MNKIIAIALMLSVISCGSEPAYALSRFPVYYENPQDENVILAKGGKAKSEKAPKEKKAKI